MSTKMCRYDNSLQQFSKKISLGTGLWDHACKCEDHGLKLMYMV